MRKRLFIVAALLLPALGWAAGDTPTYPNDEIEID